MGRIMIAVQHDEDGSRLDRWLMHKAGVSFVQVQKWVRTGQVRVDGKRAKPDMRLSAGQSVRVPPLEAVGAGTRSATPAVPRVLTAIQRQTIRDSILYRDDHILILNKPYGLAVQGGSGTTQHLDEWLRLWGVEERIAPRLTHRLDRDTSGVLAVALTREAAAGLTGAFRKGEAEKIYWALVVGVPPRREGVIDLPLAKSGSHGEELMTVSPDGKPAVTRYRTCEHIAKTAAWLELFPEQGRTHQLRVHCAASGFPIQGDRKYGRRAAFLSGVELSQKLHLHARQLIIRHPVTGEKKSFIAPLSEHMRTTWEMLGWSPEGSV
jgi:23S rRNA pseudouridine955/2504/2580 synthase